MTQYSDEVVNLNQLLLSPEIVNFIHASNFFNYKGGVILNVHSDLLIRIILMQTNIFIILFTIVFSQRRQSFITKVDMGDTQWGGLGIQWGEKKNSMGREKITEWGGFTWN